MIHFFANIYFLLHILITNFAKCITALLFTRPPQTTTLDKKQMPIIIKNLSYCTTVKQQFKTNKATLKTPQKAAPFSRSGAKAGYITLLKL